MQIFFAIILKHLRVAGNIYSSIAQSVEHAAVNRRVVGSSPTWGAKRKGIAFAVPFFLFVYGRRKGEKPRPCVTDAYKSWR